MNITKHVLYAFLLFLNVNLVAQSSKIPISVGYFAPYGIHSGLKLSTALDIQNWERGEQSRLHTLSISPQIGYWRTSAYSNEVNNSWVLDAQLEYKIYNAQQTFYGLFSAGLGYHFTQENTVIGIDIGTGQPNNITTTSHHFVPSVNIGFGQNISDRFGYYLKAFTGQRFSSNVGNDYLLGGELGVTFFIKK